MDKMHLKRSYGWASLVYVILGGTFLFRPEMSLTTISSAIGILILLYGVVHLIIYFAHDRMVSVYGYDLVVGIIAAVIGVFMLILPKLIASVLPFVMGIFLIAGSIMKIQNAIDLNRMEYPRWWSTLISAVISLLFGLFLFWNPFGAVKVTIMIIGIALLLDGLAGLWSMFMLARNVKKVRRNMAEEEERTNMERVQGEVVFEGNQTKEEPEVIDEEVVSEEGDLVEVKQVPKRRFFHQ